jgi:hypothetical protein
MIFRKYINHFLQQPQYIVLLDYLWREEYEVVNIYKNVCFLWDSMIHLQNKNENPQSRHI